MIIYLHIRFHYNNCQLFNRISDLQFKTANNPLYNNKYLLYFNLSVTFPNPAQFISGKAAGQTNVYVV